MNNYILEYYQSLKNGSVCVGRWVRLAYERIIEGLSSGQYIFSQKKADRCIRFMETFVRHHEGALAPQVIKLELWQKAYLSCLFGIVDPDGNRQFRESVLIIARKNGKTLLAAGIALYMTFLDGEYGQRTYFAAPKLEQANLCYDAFYQMIQKEPELSQISKKRRTDIYVQSTNSTAKPLAFNAKKSDGLNVGCGICDEIASWKGDPGLKFYDVLKSSQGARKQPLLLSISTAGYENDGIYDELIKRCTRVLLGESSEHRLLPMIYMIDNPDQWADINELRKANPNLGVSVSVDYLIEEVAVAENSLSKKAEFLTKYCNIKQNSAQAWLSANAVELSSGDALSLEDFRGSYCVVGIDLSRTTDLTAVCAVIEREGVLYVFSEFYLPGEKIQDAIAREGVPYQIYAQRGYLKLSGDNYVDYKDCFNFCRRLVEDYQIYPLRVGYDRYSAQYLVQELTAYGFVCDDVNQGFNLTSVIEETEGLFEDGCFRIGDNDLMKMHLLNAAMKTDSELCKRRLIKMSPSVHIDGTAALLDAMCMRQKYCAEIGQQLRNEG